MMTHIAVRNFAHRPGMDMGDATRSGRMTQLAAAQREWLDDVVQKSGMTLSTIARDARINPSTLTRFRNNAHHNGVLSTPTMVAVSQISGTPLPGDLSAPRAVPAGQPRGFRETEASPYQLQPNDPMAPAVATQTEASPHLVPWELRSQALLHEGYKPGDILIVDLNGAPQSGDIVCAQLYDWQNRSGTETVFRLYEPPFLIASGPVEAARKPRLTTGDDVAVKGVVVMMLRRPAAGSPQR